MALKRGHGAHSVAPEMGSASPRRAVGSGVPGGGVALVGADVRLDHGPGDVVTWRCGLSAVQGLEESLRRRHIWARKGADIAVVIVGTEEEEDDSMIRPAIPS